MARIKYYYDTQTCKYERVKVKNKDVILNALGLLALTLVLAIGINIIYNSYFESPDEAQLRKENEELKFYYDIIEKEIDGANKMMQVLQDRDDNIYRTIFEAEPIPNTIRQAGYGGTDRYKNLIEKGLEREELIVQDFKRIDHLKKQMYIQTKSYDELLEMAKNKSKMWASIPAIQPLTNKDLNRLASGYGMRMHPILKTKKFHSGIDFSAPKGTPIYATGNGKVVKVKSSFGGYGKQVVIDHGFGYKTLYGHMSKFNVKKGQVVKRGECIGYVGNTGQSTGPHIHYEVIKDGKVVNPVHYFYKDLNDDEYQKILELASIENQSLG
ncbi:M23 family metallopeptidase [Xanthovirga aplysinae]|uniref:M23 family metallopeptidase n=1 Tax=Xanthovirga aplysinae TaxID=2529853 RepID=UPI0012BCFCBA|nr:M23 family metallopeptidase [Xanthovirga aplysinae]MTI32025.1 M23 family metallopeptidase [Xanthovirga aplysinae]